MKKIILIIIVSIWGTYQFKPELLSFGSTPGAYDDQGNPLTLVFTHPQCKKPCEETLSLLAKRRIQYTEYIQDGDVESRQVWKKHGGYNKYPFLVIGNETVMGSYKSMLVSKLAIAYGDAALTKSERFYMKKHFHEDGLPKLVMYSADWCQYCRKLRNALNENKIDYIEIDVEKSSWGKSLMKTLRISGYPTVYYGYELLHKTDPKSVLARI